VAGIGRYVSNPSIYIKLARIVELKRDVFRRYVHFELKIS
jgi:hypothetical protein